MNEKRFDRFAGGLLVLGRPLFLCSDAVSFAWELSNRCQIKLIESALDLLVCLRLPIAFDECSTNLCPICSAVTVVAQYPPLALVAQQMARLVD